MRKKILVLLFIVLLFSTSLFFAMADTHLPETTTTNIQLESLGFSPRIIVSYSKTITNYYNDHTSCPTSIVYSEYKLDTWFSGVLYLTNITKSGNGWNATYSGTLYGNP